MKRPAWLKRALAAGKPFGKLVARARRGRGQRAGDGWPWRVVGEAEMSRIAQVNLEMQRPGRKEEIQERVRTAKLISQPTMRSWPSAWPSRRDTVVSGW
jgi:hypothetical protein